MKTKTAFTALFLVTILLSLSVSCDRSDIIHTYKPDVSRLSVIDTLKETTVSQLPEPTSRYATDGVNTSSKSKQPDDIRDWVEYELPSSVDGRHVTINLRIFSDGESAERFMDFELKNGWYRSEVDKFTRGTLPNGVVYCASYISQHRSDPEGCSRPMDSYSSFLLIRSKGCVVSIDVLEGHASGVASTDIDYVVKLLEPRR